jgi:hypothetical protein
MSANITAAAAGSSADLLTDLKSGYLLGAHPRKQFIAQFAGIFVGTLVSVLCFRLLVPDASALGTDQFPAPAAQTWRAVAVALSEGLGALGPVKIWCIAIGGLVGILLTLLPRIFPTRQHLIPSPAGVGLAWTFHWHYGLLFFIGGVSLVDPEEASEVVGGAHLPVASGLDRRREPDGRGPRDVGERAGAGPEDLRPLKSPLLARVPVREPETEGDEGKAPGGQD